MAKKDKPIAKGPLSPELLKKAEARVTQLQDKIESLTDSLKDLPGNSSVAKDVKTEIDDLKVRTQQILKDPKSVTEEITQAAGRAKGSIRLDPNINKQDYSKDVSDFIKNQNKQTFRLGSSENIPWGEVDKSIEPYSEIKTTRTIDPKTVSENLLNQKNIPAKNPVYLKGPYGDLAKSKDALKTPLLPAAQTSLVPVKPSADTASELASKALESPKIQQVISEWGSFTQSTKKPIPLLSERAESTSKLPMKFAIDKFNTLSIPSTTAETVKKTSDLSPNLKAVGEDITETLRKAEEERPTRKPIKANPPELTEKWKIFTTPKNMVKVGSSDTNWLTNSTLEAIDNVASNLNEVGGDSAKAFKTVLKSTDTLSDTLAQVTPEVIATAEKTAASSKDWRMKAAAVAVLALGAAAGVATSLKKEDEPTPEPAPVPGPPKDKSEPEVTPPQKLSLKKLPELDTAVKPVEYHFARLEDGPLPEEKGVTDAQEGIQRVLDAEQTVPYQHPNGEVENIKLGDYMREAYRAQQEAIANAIDVYKKEVSENRKTQIFKSMVEGIAQLINGAYGLKNADRGVIVQDLKFDPMPWLDRSDEINHNLSNSIAQAKGITEVAERNKQLSDEELEKKIQKETTLVKLAEFRLKQAEEQRDIRNKNLAERVRTENEEIRDTRTFEEREKDRAENREAQNVGIENQEILQNFNMDSRAALAAAKALKKTPDSAKLLKEINSLATQWSLGSELGGDLGKSAAFRAKVELSGLLNDPNNKRLIEEAEKDAKLEQGWFSKAFGFGPSDSEIAAKVPAAATRMFFEESGQQPGGLSREEKLKRLRGEK
jgi:hypothetical protein